MEREGVIGIQDAFLPQSLAHFQWRPPRGSGSGPEETLKGVGRGALFEGA